LDEYGLEPLSAIVTVRSSVRAGTRRWSTPAINHEIAEHLSLSVDAVKTHL